MSNLQELELRWNASDVSDAERVEIVKELQSAAPEDGKICHKCHQNVVYAPLSRALVEGHCYSNAGVGEVGISGICEFCFDALFAEDEGV